MKTLAFLFWNGLGILITACLYSVYDAATSHQFFYTTDQPISWYSHFSFVFWDDLFGFNLIGLILIGIAAPIYGVLFHYYSQPLASLRFPVIAWIMRSINCWLVLYIFIWTGQAVKSIFGGPPDLREYARSFLNSGGVFALPFITTLISLLLGLIFDWLLRLTRKA